MRIKFDHETVNNKKVTTAIAAFLRAYLKQWKLKRGLDCTINTSHVRIAIKF